MTLPFRQQCIGNRCCPHIRSHALHQYTCPSCARKLVTLFLGSSRSACVIMTRCFTYILFHVLHRGHDTYGAGIFDKRIWCEGHLHQDKAPPRNPGTDESVHGTKLIGTPVRRRKKWDTPPPFSGFLPGYVSAAWNSSMVLLQYSFFLLFVTFQYLFLHSKRLSSN